MGDLFEFDVMKIYSDVVYVIVVEKDVVFNCLCVECVFEKLLCVFVIVKGFLDLVIRKFFYLL